MSKIIYLRHYSKEELPIIDPADLEINAVLLRKMYEDCLIHGGTSERLLERQAHGIDKAIKAEMAKVLGWDKVYRYLNEAEDVNSKDKL